MRQKSYYQSPPTTNDHTPPERGERQTWRQGTLKCHRLFLIGWACNRLGILLGIFLFYPLFLYQPERASNSPSSRQHLLSIFNLNMEKQTYQPSQNASVTTEDTGVQQKDAVTTSTPELLDAEKQQCSPCGPSVTESAFKGLGWLDRYLAVWIFLAMAIGIILGNFVPNTGPALEKGKFVEVSIPIGVAPFPQIEKLFLTFWSDRTPCDDVPNPLQGAVRNSSSRLQGTGIVDSDWLQYCSQLDRRSLVHARSCLGLLTRWTGTPRRSHSGWPGSVYCNGMATPNTPASPKTIFTPPQ